MRLVLRSIFLCRKWELNEFFNSDRFSVIYPDIWEEFVGFIPEKERNDLMKAYEKRMFTTNNKTKNRAIQLFSFWDVVRQQLIPEVNKSEDIVIDAKSFGWKIYFHYHNHNMFLKENELIKNINKIRHIPGVIMHGRYDLICPLQNAWDLHKAWPEAEFYIISGASHKLTEPGMTDKFIEYTDTLE